MSYEGLAACGQPARFSFWSTEVHAALAYAYDHHSEIDEYFERSRQAVAELEAEIRARS